MFCPFIDKNETIITVGNDESVLLNPSILWHKIEPLALSEMLDGKSRAFQRCKFTCVFLLNYNLCISYLSTMKS